MAHRRGRTAPSDTAERMHCWMIERYGPIRADPVSRWRAWRHYAIRADARDELKRRRAQDPSSKFRLRRWIPAPAEA